MGAWGVEVFEDDVTLDARDELEEALDDGLSIEEAIAQVREDLDGLLDDPEDNPKVVLALAVTAHERGVLPDSLRQEALQVLRDGAILKLWEGTPDYAARQAEEQRLLKLLEG